MQPPPSIATKRIETKRLILRVPTLRDAAKLNAEIRVSMPRLAPWILWAKTTPTLAKSRRYCARLIKGHRTKKELGYIVLTKETGVLVGGIGLHRLDWTIPKLEVGYWVGTRFEGQGFVTEAVCALTEFAFTRLGAARVELLCDKNNSKSRKVALRAGYRLEGVHRQAKRNNGGELCDMYVFARTQPERFPIGRPSRSAVRKAR